MVECGYILLIGLGDAPAILLRDYGATAVCLFINAAGCCCWLLLSNIFDEARYLVLGAWVPPAALWRWVTEGAWLNCCGSLLEVLRGEYRLFWAALPVCWVLWGAVMPPAAVFLILGAEMSAGYCCVGIFA